VRTAEPDDENENHEEDSSVNNDIDQTSSSVGPSELCEVCLIDERDTQQALVSCGHQRFCGSCVTKIKQENRGCRMCRALGTMILSLFWLLYNVSYMHMVASEINKMIAYAYVTFGFPY